MEKEITNSELLKSINKGFSKIEEDHVELLESINRSFSNIEKKDGYKR